MLAGVVFGWEMAMYAFIVTGHGHQASGGTLRHAIRKGEQKPISH